MKNVTPQPPRPYVPPGLDRSSYLQGVFDTRLEWAEVNHWREQGFSIDNVTGKLVPIEEKG